MEQEKSKYTIKVKTGLQTWAGCDNKIKLEIHGTKGKTKLQTIFLVC